MNEESPIGKFFGLLGFKVDHSGLQEFKASLDHVKHAAEGIFAIAVIEKLTAFVERSIGAAAAVNDLAEITDLSAEKISALGRVAIENSVSVETMQGALQGVYRAAGQVAMGVGRNVQIFQKLGLSAKDAGGKVKGADILMEELAGKFQSMDLAKAVGMGARLGLDAMLVKTMRSLGSKGWAEAVKEAMGKGLLTNEDYEAADKTERAFRRFHVVAGQLATLVANQLAPWLRRAVDAVEDFFVENKVEFTKKLHSAMKTLSEVLSRVWEFGSKLYDVMSKLYSKMNATKYAGEAFRLVLVAIAAVEAAQTVGKIAEAVTNLYKALTKIPKLLGGLSLLVVAVGLLVEDWLAFKNGEESVIGDLEKRWPAAFKAIKVVMDSLLGVWEDILDAARALGIIQAAPPKKGSLAWYEQEKSKPHYQDSMTKEDWDLWSNTKAQVEGGMHPEQLLAKKLMAESGAGQSFANWKPPESGVLTSTSSWNWKDWLGSIFAGGSMGEMQQSMKMLHALNEDRRAKEAAGNVYVTGTKVEVKADTPERAARAGESVREALANTQIRNYQPKGI